MLRNTESLRVLVVGCGNMGASHARAFRNMREAEIVGLVSRDLFVRRDWGFGPALQVPWKWEGVTSVMFEVAWMV
jgi:hypothetical protein